MKQFYKLIPGWFSFKQEYDQAIARADSNSHNVFVECGAYKGKSTSYMAVEVANSDKPITFYTIDTFQGSEEHFRKGHDVSNLYWKFENNVVPVREWINVIAKPTTEAAKTFQDQSIGFLFLDASHTYEDVVADIYAFWPKLKSGGMLAGDDYSWDSVKRAVQHCFGDGYEVRGNSWKIFKR